MNNLVRPLVHCRLFLISNITFFAEVGSGNGHAVDDEEDLSDLSALSDEENTAPAAGEAGAGGVALGKRKAQAGGRAAAKRVRTRNRRGS